MPDVIKFFFYFMAVLALIGVCTWAARRFMAARLNTTAGRGRMPRLSVIDAADFGDGRRKLVLVRRDNVEHLVMVGGPSDVVIETNIQRAAAAATRAPQSDPSWLDSEPAELREPAPMPEPLPPPRPSRPPFVGDEPRRPPPPMPAPPERRPEPRHEPRPEPITGFASDTMRPPMRVAKPPMPRQPVASAPPVTPPVAPPVASAASEAAAQADQNLAEMAQRLEAALRRPGAEPGPSVAVSPVDRIGAPPVAPDGPHARKAPPIEPPSTAEAPPRKEETGFESLEAEMASLLGRPKNPT